MMPADERELANMIAEAAGRGGRLAIRGGGSKAGIGADVQADPLDLSAFTGVIDYDPAELVLTVRAATPLVQVAALVAAEGQMLAFDPFDHGPIFGAAAGRATIGGVLAAGVAGSQRLSQGAGRDHLLGFKGVSGRGERFVAGAAVVKNVTGYDLPKLAVNSWGRLFAMTEVTVRVLPAPRMAATRIVDGLDYAAAQAIMAAALGSTAEVAAAAFLPARGSTPSRTAIRLQGFAPSVEARLAILDRIMGQGARHADAEEARAIREALTTLAPLAGGAGSLWRVNLPPSRSPGFVADVAGDWMADWAGGLVWLKSEADPRAIRAAAERGGGHAMLVRASAATRALTPALHPLPSAVATLEERLRRAFDPAGVFETGRFAAVAP